MREIRFRAWAYSKVGDPGGINRPKVEPSKPKMYYDVQNSYDNNWESFGEVLSGGYCKEVMSVMQYTELEDKNGKKIYEGDVIRTPEGKNAMVKIMHGMSIAVTDGFRFNVLPDINNVSEIIGNLHENPELYSGKHESFKNK